MFDLGQMPATISISIITSPAAASLDVVDAPATRQGTELLQIDRKVPAPELEQTDGLARPVSRRKVIALGQLLRHVPARWDCAGARDSGEGLWPPSPTSYLTIVETRYADNHALEFRWNMHGPHSTAIVSAKM